MKRGNSIKDRVPFIILERCGLSRVIDIQQNRKSHLHEDLHEYFVVKENRTLHSFGVMGVIRLILWHRRCVDIFDLDL